VFSGCIGLTGVYFKGNPPTIPTFASPELFPHADQVVVYYRDGTTGWRDSYVGRPTALWRPEVKTSDASFGVKLNEFGFNIVSADDMIVVVEASSNLANPAWSPVGTNSITGGSSYFSDPQWINFPTRIYRIRIP
jgi:hypothetical protein